MKPKFLILLTYLLALFSCSSSDNNTSNQPDFSKEQTLLDISYGNSSQQKFDLYLPANRSNSNTKVLVLVHGGGWIEGDKNDMNYLVSIIKQNLPSYAVVNINYRLATTGNPAYPMQIDDITSALNKLKGGNYGISNKYGFIGVSAGAHLSLLHSYAFNSNSETKMVCSIIGPTNFTDPNYVNNPVYANFYTQSGGQTYAQNPTFFEQISPLHRATTTSPPTIMLYGNADNLIPITQSQGLKQKLDQLGVYNELYLYNGGHGDWAPADQLNAYGNLINFINSKF